ncbi:MAG TPA: hemerythrin domain-containing protein [Acidimicrobiia bacterium]
MTRRDVLSLVEAGVGYDDVGRRLGIHPGLAYMIATGLPADGSDTLVADDTRRPGFVETSTQHLANPVPVHNPTHRDEVQRWIHQRVRRDAQMRDAGDADWPTPPSLGQTNDADADVVALLPRDHNAFHKLTNRLKYTPTKAKGASEDQIALRAATLEAIRIGLERHEAAEEQHLWPFVRSKLANGDDVADDAQRQEKQGNDILADLADTPPGTEQWDALADKLQHALRGHVAFEDQVLLALQEVTTADERRVVGERLAASERTSHEPA